MTKLAKFNGMLAAVAVLGAFTISNVQAPEARADDNRVEVGLLDCKIRSGTNFIIGSTKTLRCRLKGVSGSTIAVYSGKMESYGLDIGEARATNMVWTVIAPTREIKRTSLNGNYVGVAADASLGLGGGAKVLVGGSGQTITLQPLSLQEQRGINLALTVSGLSLRAE